MKESETTGQINWVGVTEIGAKDYLWCARKSILKHTKELNLNMISSVGRKYRQ